MGEVHIIGADESTLELIGFNSIEEMKKNKKNISIRPIEAEKLIDKKRNISKPQKVIIINYKKK